MDPTDRLGTTVQRYEVTSQGHMAHRYGSQARAGDPPKVLPLRDLSTRPAQCESPSGVKPLFWCGVISCSTPGLPENTWTPQPKATSVLRFSGQV